MEQVTNNGIMYTKGVVECGGADFILFPEDRHNDQDIETAKEDLRDLHGVVSIRVASEPDRWAYIRSKY